MQLTEFLTTHAPALTARILAQFAPLYTPTVDRRRTLAIPGLKRPLFDAQADTVAALACAFRTYTSLGMAAEPGFGKTCTTLALARVLGCRRMLVLCPPHLVEEWREEAARCLDNCPAYILETITDVETALAASRRSTAPLHLFILSHSRAKLRYGWRPAVQSRRWKIEGQLVTQFLCPSCGQEILDDQGAALALSDLERAQRQCGRCRGALWQPIITSRRIVPLAVYIKRKHRGVFDLLIGDELHEYKSQTTAQALAFHALMRACPRTLGLTGTLSSGKASDVFPLLYRLSPEIRARYSHDQVLAFVRDYGILERVTYHDDTSARRAEDDEDGAGSIRKGGSDKAYERPGLSPAIVPLLLNRFVFLRLSDIAHALPPYEEIVHPLALPPDVADSYGVLERKAIEWARAHRGGGIAQFLQALLGYPDQPWAGETLTAVIRDQDGTRQRTIVASVPPLDTAQRFPKEEALLALLRRERARGRKVLVFVIHTETRDIIPRLTQLAAADGLTLAALRSGGDTRTRKQQLRRLLAQGADGIVCHPRLVQTGLNLIDFPTTVFYQFDYSTFTLRQASRRGYRPSQWQPVEVHFFCYEGTVQEKGLALMARKLRSALMAEGEFVDEGLSAFGDEGDITRELTRCLLDGHAVPGLEETFQALRALRPELKGNGYVGGETPSLATPVLEGDQRRAEGEPQNGVAPEIVAHVLPPGAFDAEAWRRLEELRAKKHAEESRRKRVTLTRTLAGNPGQLSLFQ
jgi:superfamily II DNA or RNA helicase